MNRKFFIQSMLSLELMSSSLSSLTCPQDYIDFYVAPTANSLKFNLPYTNSTTRYKAEYNLTQLNGVKGGVRAQIFLSSRWFLKGYADYGWIFSGNMKLNDHLYSYSASTRGNLTDGSIGAGYNFYPLSRLQIAPTIGWSFEKIYIYTKHLKRNSIDRPDQRFKSILGGPYLGFETVYYFNCDGNWSLMAGYECHIAVSRIHVYDENATTSAHLRNLIGNYAHIGLNYQISDCWNAGIDIVGYVYNSNRTGTLTPTEIGTTYEDRRIKNVQVKTGEIRFFTGYTF
jgi:hypothetical protein